MSQMQYTNFLVNQSNCMSSYWRPIVKAEKNMSNCTLEQLEVIHHFAYDRENVPFFYKSSCVSDIQVPQFLQTFLTSSRKNIVDKTFGSFEYLTFLTYPPKL